MIPTFTLPTPPPEPANHSFPSWRDWVVSYAQNVGNYVVSYEAEWARQFNSLLNGAGPDIASATAITVRNAVHRVTGTTAIATITQPTGQSAVGVLTLLSKDGFSLVSGGNISVAGTALISAGSAVMLAYDPVLKQWITAVSQGKTFSAINFIGAANSPYAVPGGSVFIAVALDAGNVIANLSTTPTIGDTATIKVVSNPTGLNQCTIQPAGGMTLDGSAVGFALKQVNASRSALYAATNQWLFYATV